MEVTSGVKEMLAKKEEELSQVKSQIQQIDQEQQRLQKIKDQLLTKGIEIQGMVKVLQELMNSTPVVPEVVKE
jgi:chromosome segregation ATPase